MASHQELNLYVPKQTNKRRAAVPGVGPIRCSAHDELGDPMIVNKLYKAPGGVIGSDDDLARIDL